VRIGARRMGAGSTSRWSRGTGNLRGEIRPALEKRAFPVVEWSEPPQLDHGRIDRRRIAIPPAEALGEDIRREWPTIGRIARVPRMREPVGNGRIARRWRKRKGKGGGGGDDGMVDRPPASDRPADHPVPEPQSPAHRDHASRRGRDPRREPPHEPPRPRPRNIFTPLGATRTLPERIATSPTRAIEMIRDDRSGALDIPSGRKPDFHRIAPGAGACGMWAARLGRDRSRRKTGRHRR